MTIISQDLLRRDLVRVMAQIDAQIEEVTEKAREMGITPEKMRDANANWVMIPLLLAKTQAYTALVQLNQSRKR